MSFLCADPEKLYSRDPKIQRIDVQIIREWLKKQPHLPELEEVQIILALHHTYYQIEAAKTIIDNYFTIRSLCPDIFTALSPDLIKSTSSTAFVKVLPKKTPEGYLIFLMKLSDFRSESFNFTDIMKLFLMAALLSLHQRGLVNGTVAVFDAKGFNLGHLTRLNLNYIRYILQFVQEGLPVRIKGIHVMNSRSLIDKVIAVFKPFLNTELYNMLQFHSPNTDSLYKSVPRECLPEDYGGQQPSCQVLTEENVRSLLNNYEFFKWHNSQTVDQSKRLEKATIGAGFGVEGTFKKLELD